MTSHPEVTRTLDDAKIAAQVATEYLINHHGDGFDAGTVAAVRRQAEATGVAPLYLAMLADLFDPADDDLMPADHERVEVRELGYARDVCSVDGVDWPCPTVAQAREREAIADYPAVVGDVVTERHARICRERGHASWTRDGVDVGACPRCGDSVVDVVGMINADMIGTPAEVGERVDWNRPDLKSRDEWLDVLGVDVDAYAADHPHMIAFEVAP